MQRGAITFFTKKADEYQQEIFELADTFFPKELIKLILQALCRQQDARSVGRMKQVNKAFCHLIEDVFLNQKLNPRMRFFFLKYSQLQKSELRYAKYLPNLHALLTSKEAVYFEQRADVNRLAKFNTAVLMLALQYFWLNQVDSYAKLAASETMLVLGAGLFLLLVDKLESLLNDNIIEKSRMPGVLKSELKSVRFL